MINDKDMYFDKKLKRYRLSKDYVKNELGMDLQSMLYDELDANPTTLPNRVIKYTSDMIYDYMRRVCADYNYASELIVNNEEIHEAFKLCLSYQLQSFAMEGDKSTSADGSIEKSICPKSMQVLLGYKLLTCRRPRRCNINLIWDLQDMWADYGGGWF